MGNSNPYANALKPITTGIASCKILIQGLETAGKSTILNKLDIGEIVTVIPTIGWNVESVQYKNIDLLNWDVGGQDKIRPLYMGQTYNNTTALIFVLDSTDRISIDIQPEHGGSAQDELHQLLSNDDLRDAELLIFANKQDLPNAMDLFEIADKLDIANVRRDWFMQASCAITGDGLCEGL